MARARRRVVVLGSTGSIVRAALEVAEASPDAFEVIGLSAHTNVELLAEQARRHGVRRVAVAMYHSAISRMPLGCFKKGAGTRAMSPKPAPGITRSVPKSGR